MLAAGWGVDLRPRLRTAGVDRWVRDLDKASDHAPTWIELAPGTTRRSAPKPETGWEYPSIGAP